MSKPVWMFTATALLLSGCGGAPAGGGNAAAPEATPAASTAAAASDFDATNACAILPADKVTAVTGLKVDSANLGTVVEPGEGTAGFSTCNYSFAGGGTLAFFARQSPVDDNTPEAIARTRKELTDNMGATIVDVPGLGTAAFSAEQMHQLHVFFAGNRYIYFMSPAPPAGKPIGEAELALAKAVIG
ncbi:hypothetical protein P6144_18220 [Sphingomonas sp. HITSZ_GF]|uniref:hypothetical protein n=1 Tax=Sphingomonas sp. HITSZ_GF TaxID=3037247 RepID=UPI00240E2E0B|nr:hypothetical protein [Sphingomonas sp. HITSZ_GF]MDG2535603.1 hypothetical protein [Sphingomonas sp. HITSZ_GF]